MRSTRHTTYCVVSHHNGPVCRHNDCGYTVYATPSQVVGKRRSQMPTAVLWVGHKARYVEGYLPVGHTLNRYNIFNYLIPYDTMSYKDNKHVIKTLRYRSDKP